MSAPAADGLIEASVARLFAGGIERRTHERVEAGEWPDGAWSDIEHGGLTLALAGEASGGSGLTWSDAWPILRGIGYWQVPLPLAETMVAAQRLSMAGVAVPDGPIALLDATDAPGLAVSDDGRRIDGVATRIAWARHCTHALIEGRDGRVGLVSLAARHGASVTPAVDVAGMPSDTVRFDGAACIAQGVPPALPESPASPLRILCAVARSAMIVGALESVLAQSVQYAKDRVQFGRPIGSFQAIQQALALLAGEVAAARMAARVAADDAPSADAAMDPDAAARAFFSAAVAKVRCGEAASRAAAIAHQVHGAIGFTREHALHRATRRLWAWREQAGSDAWWAQRLGEAAIRGGSGRFWSTLTQRRAADAGDDRA
jgi:acyl-CoA dehydrogenase